MNDYLIFDSISDYINRAKNIAYFIPGPLIIHHTLLDSTDVFQARCVLNHIGTSDFNLSLNQDIIPKFKRYQPFIRALLHERMHFWQYSSTTFGYLISKLNMYQTDQILIQTKKIHDKYGNKIYIPLTEWKKKSQNEEIRENIERLDEFYESIQYLQNILHGKVIINATSASELYLNIIKLISSKRTDRHLLPPLDDDFDIQPFQGPRIKNIPKIGDDDISASAIIEGHAILFQTSLEMALKSKLGIDEESNTVSARHNHIFNPLFKSMKSSFSESDILFLFPIISDLSLLSPIDQGYLDIREGLIWEDIDPGWRFCRMIDYLKYLKSRNELPEYSSYDLTEEQKDEFYLDISERICTDFDWPTLKEICESSQWKITRNLHDILLNEFSNLRIKYPSIFAFPMDERNMDLLAKNSPDIIFFDKIMDDELLAKQLKTKEMNGLFLIHFYRYLISRGLLRSRDISNVFNNDETFNREIHPIFFQHNLNFPLSDVKRII